MPIPAKRSARRAVATIAVSVTLAVPTAAVAQNKLDCASAMATPELNACSELELERADDLMNAIYKKLLAKIAASKGDKPYDARSWEAALRASQRAWVAFRDADCKGLVPMAWGGGTGTTGEVLGCMTEKTIRRTDELTAHYEVE